MDGSRIELGDGRLVLDLTRLSLSELRDLHAGLVAEVRRRAATTGSPTPPPAADA